MKSSFRLCNVLIALLLSPSIVFFIFSSTILIRYGDYFDSNVIAVAEASKASFSVSDYICADNSGYARESVYGIGVIPPSYDVEYYDCYVPYNMSMNEIGGYANCAVETSIRQYNSGMLESTTKGKITGWSIRENDFSLKNSVRGSAVRSHEGTTGMVTYTSARGDIYYVCALPNFCYRSEQALSKEFPYWDISNRGQLVDIILTDGTVIHFVVGDVADTRHTNGGDEDSELFEVRYSFTELNYSQYRHLYHAQSGHSIELWGIDGCSQAFDVRFGIGNGLSDNRIAYIRMYNAYLSSNPKRVNGVPQSVSYVVQDIADLIIK